MASLCDPTDETNRIKNVRPEVFDNNFTRNTITEFVKRLMEVQGKSNRTKKAAHI